MRGPQPILVIQQRLAKGFQPGTTCADPSNLRRLVLPSRNVTAGVSLLDPLNYRLQVGWMTVELCPQGGASILARTHLNLFSGRLVDQPTLGAVLKGNPAAFDCCM